ncbi:hypothetical protein BDV59DRAFT_188755 [Aspergillus ambiguus]|uniref:uncharacterized protein n=1 Tax=Aspergillus ambiguus TaxID=176160 RepID=UPI003CCE1E2E
MAVYSDQTSQGNTGHIASLYLCVSCLAFSLPYVFWPRARTLRYVAIWDSPTSTGNPGRSTRT